MRVMYHHIHDESYCLSHLGHLPLKNFLLQLEWLGFDKARPNTALSLSNKVELTFDDGLKSHLDYVAPALLAKRLPATFYVQTMPLIEWRACNVHLCQYLISRAPAESILNHMISEGIVDGELSQISATYVSQDALPLTKMIKTYFNYVLEADIARERLLHLISKFEDFEEKAFINSLYLNRADLVSLIEMGFKILPHFHSHSLLTSLTDDKLLREFDLSMGFFEELLGKPIEEICVPYGGPKSSDARCEVWAKEKGIRTVVLVQGIESILKEYSENLRYVSRTDCSELPFSDYQEGDNNQTVSLG